jgi:signal transduction histidine kinase
MPLRLRFASRSSTSLVRLGLLLAASLLAGAAAGVYAAAGLGAGQALALVAAVAAATLLGIFLFLGERERHERAEERLADRAARAGVSERLLAEAQVREAERAQLTEQLLTAEQDERRRLALFLHDGPVQSLAGIALMLDSVQDSIAAGRPEEAQAVVAAALERHRATIRALRDLSFNLEPVVLRDQGFASAVQALADQLGLQHSVQIDVDVAAADVLGEKAQAGLYQIIRDALNAAIRRGPPTRMSVDVRRADGDIETVIVDDAPGERRRATFDALAERARTLNGRLAVAQGEQGGTTVSVILPTYAARG